MTEVVAQGISHPALVERMAIGAEAAGFDGMLAVDSQNLVVCRAARAGRGRNWGVVVPLDAALPARPRS